MPALAEWMERARQIGADPAADVPSPCISVCRMDPRTEWCEGCYRTLEEIAAWSTMEDEEKRAVWQTIAERALKEEKAVIPAQVTRSVIPAQAGTQGCTPSESLGSPPSRG